MGEKKNYLVLLVYVLHLCSILNLLFIFLGSAIAFIALFTNPEEKARKHLDFQFTTFWKGLIVFFLFITVGALSLFMQFSFSNFQILVFSLFIHSTISLWVIARAINGIRRWAQDKSIYNEFSWLIGE